MNDEYIERLDLKVARELANFIETEAMAGLEITTEVFWSSASSIFDDLGQKGAVRLTSLSISI